MTGAASSWGCVEIDLGGRPVAEGRRHPPAEDQLQTEFSKVTDYLEADKGAWKREYLPGSIATTSGPASPGAPSAMPPLADDDNSPFYSNTVRGDVPRQPGYEGMRAGAAPHLPSNKCPGHGQRDVPRHPSLHLVPRGRRPQKSLLQKRRAATPSWRKTEEPSYKSKITGNIYCGNGQVWDLSTNQTTALAELEMLRDDDWLIDDGTRALMTEFVLYNPGTALWFIQRRRRVPPGRGRGPDV